MQFKTSLIFCQGFELHLLILYLKQQNLHFALNIILKCHRKTGNKNTNFKISLSVSLQRHTNVAFLTLEMTIWQGSSEGVVI